MTSVANVRTYVRTYSDAPDSRRAYVVTPGLQPLGPTASNQHAKVDSTSKLAGEEARRSAG